LTGPKGETVVRLRDTYRVEVTGALFGDLRATFGNQCVARQLAAR
jgi:hypothetical protein